MKQQIQRLDLILPFLDCHCKSGFIFSTSATRLAMSLKVALPESTYNAMVSGKHFKKVMWMYCYIKPNLSVIFIYC